jgi:formate hydrogenlyase subunit 3/multisubunit Na+/H+ antiporter MnhD subunit
VTRQRRTIRLVQLLLVAIAAGLFVFAGYSLGRVAGYEDGRRAERLDAPRRPSAVQTVVLLALGGVALGAAAALGTGAPRVPTPARLEELVGRAEDTAIRKAEEAASEARTSRPSRSP